MPISDHFNWTLSDAYAFWSRWKAADAETAGMQDRLDSAEIFLLEARPADLTEAVIQIEVAQHNLVDGGRSDGMDLDALDTALDLLRRLPIRDHLAAPSIRIAETDRALLAT